MIKSCVSAGCTRPPLAAAAAHRCLPVSTPRLSFLSRPRPLPSVASCRASTNAIASALNPSLWSDFFIKQNLPLPPQVQQNVVLALGVSVLLVVLSKLKSLASKPKLNLPPGPWTLPLIGSLHHLLASRSSIYRTMRGLAEEHGPVMQMWFGEVPTVVVTSAEAAREILKTHDLSFCDRPLNATFSTATFNGSDIIFSPYGERWRELRRICVMEMLTNKRVQSFRCIREEEAASLARGIAASAALGSAVNVTERIKNVINDIVVRESIGGRCKNGEEYLDALNVMIKAANAMSVADLFPSSKLMQMVSAAPRKVLAARRVIERVLGEVIEERKEYIASGVADGEEGILDVLLKLQKEGAPIITNQTMLALMFDVFSAGSETSATTLTWTMAELIRSPRVLAKAQAEVREAMKGKSRITENEIAGLTYIKYVIKETMRLHCPVPLLAPRRCRETSQVMGYDIPKGTSVFVNVWAICRDNKYWENAEEFNPDRFENNGVDFKGQNFEFLPFGGGRRICPGIGLSMANMEIVLASLLYHFDWKLPNGMQPQDLDMAEVPAFVAAKNTMLYLHPVTHIAPSDV